MKIIVTEKISDKGVALLQAVPDFDVDVLIKFFIDLSNAANYDRIIFRNDLQQFFPFDIKTHVYIKIRH